MINSGRVQGSGRARQNRFLVFLLLAAGSLSVLKDLNRLQEFSSGLPGWTSSLLHAGLTSLYASNMSAANPNCSQPRTQAEVSSDQIGWNGHVASGQSIEIKRINRELNAEPAVVGRIEVKATKKARRGEPAAVVIKVIEHSDAEVRSELRND